MKVKGLSLYWNEWALLREWSNRAFLGSVNVSYPSSPFPLPHGAGVDCILIHAPSWFDQLTTVVADSWRIGIARGSVAYHSSGASSNSAVTTIKFLSDFKVALGKGRNWLVESTLYSNFASLNETNDLICHNSLCHDNRNFRTWTLLRNLWNHPILYEN